MPVVTTGDDAGVEESCEDVEGGVETVGCKPAVFEDGELFGELP
jgi:hypothetical protein